MDAIELVRAEALRFESIADGMAPLVGAIGDARLVLIGEATHGTHEFYRTRAELTKALILSDPHRLIALAIENEFNLPQGRADGRRGSNDNEPPASRHGVMPLDESGAPCHAWNASVQALGVDGPARQAGWLVEAILPSESGKTDPQPL